MQDVQGLSDRRGIHIHRAGVRDLRYPMVILDREKGKQQTIGTFSVSAAVPHDQKGTHMSRLVEVINDHVGELTLHTLPAVLADLRRRVETHGVRLEVRFPYFLDRSAPLSGATGVMDYECCFIAESIGDTEDFVVAVTTPVTSVCPCSKAISDYGAHNQRGEVTIEVRSRRNELGEFELIWIEELIELSERSASAPVYPVLKRPDERHVTMQAYDNALFVEDIARNVAVALAADDRIIWYRVNVVNHESIHNHDAFAEVVSS
jgi:GTP cyclohydrolase I